MLSFHQMLVLLWLAAEIRAEHLAKALSMLCMHHEDEGLFLNKFSRIIALRTLFWLIMYE